LPAEVSLAAANRQNDSSESPMASASHKLSVQRLKSLFAACAFFIVDLWRVGLLV